MQIFPLNWPSIKYSSEKKLQKSNLSYQTDKFSAGTKLLMFLNILDLGVCVLTVIAQMFRLLRLITDSRVHVGLENVSELVYTIFTDNTGFAMLLLSVTRCISVSLPMYRIRGLYVAISAGMFIVYSIGRDITFYLVHIYSNYSSKDHATFIVVDLSVLIISVLVVNIISVINLLKTENLAEQSRDAGVQATVTIVILSALFCVLNTIYCAALAIQFYFGGKINDNFALWFGTFYAVPINSALNPMIYFWRKTEMKGYLIDLIKACFSFCRGRQEER